MVARHLLSPQGTSMDSTAYVVVLHGSCGKLCGFARLLLGLFRKKAPPPHPQPGGKSFKHCLPFKLHTVNIALLYILTISKAQIERHFGGSCSSHWEFFHCDSIYCFIYTSEGDFLSILF